MPQTIFILILVLLIPLSGCAPKQEPFAHKATDSATVNRDAPTTKATDLATVNRDAPTSVESVVKDNQAIAQFFQSLINENNTAKIQRDFIGKVFETEGEVVWVKNGNEISPIADQSLIYVSIKTNAEIDYDFLGKGNKLRLTFHFGFADSSRNSLADLNRGNKVKIRGRLSQLGTNNLGVDPFLIFFSESQLR